MKDFPNRKVKGSVERGTWIQIRFMGPEKAHLPESHVQVEPLEQTERKDHTRSTRSGPAQRMGFCGRLWCRNSKAESIVERLESGMNKQRTSRLAWQAIS